MKNKIKDPLKNETNKNEITAPFKPCINKRKFSDPKPWIFCS